MMKMMILDLNNVMFASVLMTLNKSKEKDIDVDLLGHIVFNSIRNLNSKFKKDYGPLIIATDSSKYWRRDQFPYYKAARKKQRDASDLNWNKIFENMHLVKNDLKDIFPYKYIEVEGAEADDIIGVICSNNKTDNILIISSDKDYLQLQTNSNIKQYDPVNNKFVTTDNAKEYLFEHIIRGDSGDGIPNIASLSNCFVLGQRQKRITQKLLDSLSNIENEPESEYYQNYMRNKQLVDLTQVPIDISTGIMEQHNAENTKDRSKLWSYFLKKKMKVLAENINDF